jgi:hypothetical protein
VPRPALLASRLMEDETYAGSATVDAPGAADDRA